MNESPGQIADALRCDRGRSDTLSCSTRLETLKLRTSQKDGYTWAL